MKSYMRMSGLKISFSQSGSIKIRNAKLSFYFRTNLFSKPFLRETIIRNIQQYIQQYIHFENFAPIYDNGLLEAQYQRVQKILSPCIKNLTKLKHFYIYLYGI